MKTQTKIAAFVAASSVAVAAYAANPASIEYIQSAVAAAKAYVAAQIASLTPGAQGPAGAAGATGATGPTGAAGANGPTAGAASQVLVKASDADYDKQWVDQPARYSIGDHAMGGIVFWVDATQQHGLIASNVTSVANVLGWGNTAVATLTGAWTGGIYTGRTNTLMNAGRLTQGTGVTLVNNVQTYCLWYSVQEDGVTPCTTGTAGEKCYGDWYVPGPTEAVQLCKQSAVIPSLTGLVDNIWTSQENSAANANAVMMSSYPTCSGTTIGKGDPNAKAHCIRAF